MSSLRCLAPKLHDIHGRLMLVAQCSGKFGIREESFVSAFVKSRLCRYVVDSCWQHQRQCQDLHEDGVLE